ncbi:MAG TPA: LacI family DNA-binding transcriptional regulator [Haloferula sp.]
MTPEPESRRFSLRDIARQLGVSHAAVSMALRDSPRISAPLKEKIRNYAEQVGYRPDPMLTALASYRQSKSNPAIQAAIAWVNAWPEPDALRNFRGFDAYWHGASAAAEKFGYRLEEFRVGRECSPKRLHQILSTRGIRALLLPPHRDQPDWGDFPWSSYSLVRFGRSLGKPHTHVVTADQVANAMLAVREILKRGYHRVGLIIEEKRLHESGHLFEGGYALAQRLIPEKDRIPVMALGTSTAAERAKAIAAWIKKHKVEAIFTDLAEVPDLLGKQGIRIPDDVALAVTSVLDAQADAGIDQHPEEIGRVGFLMLNSLINDGARGIPKIFRQILVEGSWVDGSTLPVRN